MGAKGCNWAEKYAEVMNGRAGYIGYPGHEGWKIQRDQESKSGGPRPAESGLELEDK